MPAKKTFQPLYQKLAERIGEELVQRDLKQGAFFGRLKELCERYQASIITVRKAVSLLENSGVLSCKSASGVYVKDPEVLNTLNSFRNVVLILHHHFRRIPNLFFELRLSAMLQTFAAEGFMARCLYREELENGSLPDRLSLLSDRVRGLVGGNALSETLNLVSHRHAEIPQLLINPPAGMTQKTNLCLIRYDFAELFRQSLAFWHASGSGPILRLVSDPALTPAECDAGALVSRIDLPPPDVDEPAPETGRRLAGELFDRRDQSRYWLTDDYIALGFYEEFLRRGVDLVRTRRLLVNASPSSRMTEALGMPVIGFCPMQVGREAAHCFGRFLKMPPERRDGETHRLQPSANSVVR